MAPIRDSVACVTQGVRVNNLNHRTVTAPSASDVTNNVSTHSLLDDIGHPQDTLSEVPSLASPPTEPPVAASSPPQPRTPGQGRPHVVAGVAHVPVRTPEAAAIENIQKMSTSAWGLLGKWPLSGLFGWLDGGKETGLEEPALDTKPVPGAMGGETFTATPPPPYSLKAPVRE